MNREPKTLMQLIETADKGYAISVWSETKYSDKDVVRKKIGGFKKVNDYLYQWWTGKKWASVDGKLREMTRYFALDAPGYTKLTGESLTPEIQEKNGQDIGAKAFGRVVESRQWKQENCCQKRIVVKSYLDTKKEKHAVEIYEALEDFCMAADIRAVSPEFTTGSMKTIADMVAVHGDKIEVFEIKSKGDSLKRLSDQITDYRKYADKVWAVIDVKLSSKFDKWCEDNPSLSDGLGYMSHDSGVLTVKKRASANTPTVSYLSLLWASEKKQILYGLGLPTSPTTKDGDRSQRIKNVCLDSKERYEKVAKATLIERVVNFYNGKHPKDPDMTVEKCGGAVPLSVLLTIVYGVTMAKRILDAGSSVEDVCSMSR